ncbi:MAG: hypothetical protein WC156_04845 [Pedobacter sp.]
MDMDQDIKTAVTKSASRLCSEIQLFDLCDLESCNYKVNRFCTNTQRLSKFEQIAEDDMSCPTEQYLFEELEESGFDDDEPGYGDELFGDDFDDEDDWESSL